MLLALSTFIFSNSLILFPLQGGKVAAWAIAIGLVVSVKVVR
jgi:hypothetical protein